MFWIVLDVFHVCRVAFTIYLLKALQKALRTGECCFCINTSYQRYGIAQKFGGAKTLANHHFRALAKKMNLEFGWLKYL